MLLRLPVDADGFVRRECPGCRREFKTLPSPHDGAAILWVLMGRVEHANAREIDVEPPVRACPCCARVAPGEAWLWSAFRKELSRYAEILEEHVRYEQLMHVTRTLGHNHSPTFIPVAPRPLPPRMRSDPLGHFQRLTLVCCGEELKVRPSDVGRLCCPACGARQGVGALERGPNLPAPNAVQ